VTPLPEKLLERKVIYEGRVVQRLSIDTVELPGGRVSTREIIKHPGAVCMVPVDADGRFLLVWQYRHAAGKPLLEVPAGKLDAEGESLEEAVQRELREEVGHRAGRIERLCGFYVAPGYCDEYITAYLARDLVHDPLETDFDEDIEVEAVPPVDAVGMILDGRIEDSKSITSILSAVRVLGG
jgi:ADP-ribose pyrophosphatase